MATTRRILGIGLALLVAVGGGGSANAVAADAAKTIGDVLGRPAKR